MTPIFLNRTYDEAMSLLVEARNYLSVRGAVERRDLKPDDRLAANCEAMRLTTRLTQVMAWLLVQKAVDAGEMTAIEATEDRHRLSGQTVCRERDMFAPRLLPGGLQSLLNRSYSLYTRVERLDAMMAEGADISRRVATTSDRGPGSAC